MFRNMEADIPAITLIVINTSDFLRKNIFYLVGGLIIVIILLRLLYRTVRFQISSTMGIDEFTGYR